MQNLPSKFHHFLFQSYKFAFCHFNRLSFNSPQSSLPLTFHPCLPLTIFNFYLIMYFLNERKNVNLIFFIKKKKNPKINPHPRGPSLHPHLEENMGQSRPITD